MLQTRLISAAVILAGLFGLLYADFNYPLWAPGIWLLPLGLAVAALAAHELLRLLAGQNLFPDRSLVICGTMLVTASAYMPQFLALAGDVQPSICPLSRIGWTLAAFTLCVWVALAREMLRYQGPGRATLNASLAVMILAYVGLSLAFLVQLRCMFADPKWGMVALISVIAVVKVSDAGAFAVGRLIGKLPLAPLLSPNKTVEGALGGLIAAVGASAIFFSSVAPWLAGKGAGPWWGWVAYGFVVGLSGLMGDLAESLFKRDMGQKDSSRWIPGLGGVLDVMDSVLAAAAPAWMCWIGAVVGPGTM